MSILSDAVSYTQHKEKFHSIQVAREVPVNVSGRSKKEIVAAVEDTLRAYIYTPEAMVTPAPVIAASGIPDKYCGIGGTSCVWEANGWEICGPCSVRKAAGL
jgi:hypothetical protein